MTWTCIYVRYVRNGRVYSGTYTYLVSGQVCQGTITSIGRPKVGNQYDLIIDENDPVYIVRNSDKTYGLF